MADTPMSLSEIAHALSEFHNKVQLETGNDGLAYEVTRRLFDGHIAGEFSIVRPTTEAVAA